MILLILGAVVVVFAAATFAYGIANNDREERRTGVFLSTAVCVLLGVIFAIQGREYKKSLCDIADSGTRIVTMQRRLVEINTAHTTGRVTIAAANAYMNKSAEADALQTRLAEATNKCSQLEAEFSAARKAVEGLAVEIGKNRSEQAALKITKEEAERYLKEWREAQNLQSEMLAEMTNYDARVAWASTREPFLNPFAFFDDKWKGLKPIHSFEPAPAAAVTNMPLPEAVRTNAQATTK